MAGICDRHQKICFALALWNGRDPDSQGAPVRPHRQRRQPRRGRQGVLLLPRQHAHALLHEVPVQVPAGCISLRDAAWRRIAGRGTRAAGIRTAGYRRVRRKSLLRRVRRVRQGDRRKTSWCGSQVANRGPEAADTARAADGVVPQHVVAGDGAIRGPNLAAPSRDSRHRTDGAAIRQALAALRRTRPELLFTENETNIADVVRASTAAAT